MKYSLKCFLFFPPISSVKHFKFLSIGKILCEPLRPIPARNIIIRTALQHFVVKLKKKKRVFYDFIFLFLRKFSFGKNNVCYKKNCQYNLTELTKMNSLLFTIGNFFLDCNIFLKKLFYYLIRIKNLY